MWACSSGQFDLGFHCVVYAHIRRSGGVLPCSGIICYGGKHVATSWREAHDDVMSSGKQVKKWWTVKM